MRISDWSSDVCSSDLPAAPAPDPSLIEWADVSDASACQLEIGYALVTLVDERKGSPLMTRITGIRRQLSKELGFVVPPVKVSDDLSLPGNVYRISVAGVIVGGDEVFPNELLALDSGDRSEESRGGKGGAGKCRSRW